MCLVYVRETVCVCVCVYGRRAVLVCALVCVHVCVCVCVGVSVRVAEGLRRCVHSMCVCVVGLSKCVCVGGGTFPYVPAGVYSVCVFLMSPNILWFQSHAKVK